MEIDEDYLRTGTAVGFRASRELCSHYLSFKLIGYTQFSLTLFTVNVYNFKQSCLAFVVL